MIYIFCDVKAADYRFVENPPGFVEMMQFPFQNDGLFFPYFQISIRSDTIYI
jgi:hypothetical protein